MRMTLAVHIIAGGLGLLTGYVALYTAKGATTHRKAGIFFVYAMLLTSVLGIVLAGAKDKAFAINVALALLTSCLVITSLTTVRSPAAGARWLNPSAMLVSLAVGLSTLVFGFEALANGGQRKGISAFPFFLLAVVGLLAGVGDLRMMWSGPLQGARRLARHLWRMCFALFFASLAVFPRVGRMLPRSARIPLLVIPVLTVLGTMLYWLWRVRTRRAVRDNVYEHCVEPAKAA